MCGISGEIRFDSRPASASAVGSMTEALALRGPDGQGVFAHGRMAFGHRRLSIIDLSEAAQQPMTDPELGLGIVFNGCIYNYPELRAELEAKGYRFFSHGDTEVLLKAYHAWGRRFVERLYGMFAFAIWERDSGRVTLGRDRLGIKPLYLSETAGRLRFASTLPALLAGGDVDTAIDPVGLYQYMSFHAVVPAPGTILKGVRKLPPATLLTLEPDGRRIEETYWEPVFGPQPGDERMSEGDWQDAVLSTLRKAVERRLVADVPVGVLLSGGLDSSVIVALLAEAGQTGLQTFSIGFETVGQEKGDEFQYSDLIAQRFQTDHHKLFIDSNRALPALQDCVRAMSEPMVSHDAIGFFLLSQEVSKHVKVVQSGQGADEIFAGYHWYPPMMEATDPLSTYANVFFDRNRAEMAEALNPQYLADEDVASAFVAAHFARPGADRPVDKALRLDTTVMLVDDPVKRVDNMTMAWGLEGRVPFLDHDLVELAARVPPELKVRDGGKYVLKEAARKVVPSEVIDRPKGYFPVPALKYLRGPYLELVRDVLNQPAARERALFQPAYLDRLFSDPETHITPLRGSKLWQAALLEFWLQTHGI
ncbi:N-acetylglutaminylglutamine amidotransferase [Azospirillum brasilense]|uniref:N-acetylglutaminylglutamine amidotransferase n=1 Tax=Azospirillum brasilense TaxID=192 RepID=UPI000E6A86F1|nr:N-acetylglutaminylglutamine amidotransferase [Azospirillum brasilense]NUB27565.1 N-acetylglutaminylglutamine amidotransferase [Azospirillum brasilense]NUB35093.1 N-acetylglutaminylglutamine amidotransferase [Azospirillum brasilense]RIW03404.1 N-acetylglutaminylglutamine amidotransferase [Azospirillum brasilense]